MKGASSARAYAFQRSAEQQIFEHGKKELEGQVGGVPLEQWIIASHNSAINGAMPIPPQIRQALTGYASEDSMNRVRYKIGDNGFLNLAHMLEQGGFASAVTLIDVVIFRGPSEASDPSIWAHELTHVDQYRDWRVHSFAIQYARDYNSVEAPAYAKGNGYWAWVQNNHSVVQTPTTANCGGQALFVNNPLIGCSGQPKYDHLCLGPNGSHGIRNFRLEWGAAFNLYVDQGTTYTYSCGEATYSNNFPANQGYIALGNCS